MIALALLMAVDVGGLKVPVEDHLEPSVFSGVPPAGCAGGTASVLLPERTRYVQMVTSASFDGFYAVYIVRPSDDPLERGSDFDFVVHAKRSPTGKATETHWAPIDGQTFAVLKDLWSAALSEVSFAPHGEDVRFDGAIFDFADYSEIYGYRSGSVWSPRLFSRMHDLVDVGNLLFAYAAAPEAERGKRAEELRKVAHDVRVRIAGDGPSATTDGRLLISSVPPGAHIVVDGKDAELTTPAHVDAPASTLHDIGFKLDGYRDTMKSGVPSYAATVRAVHAELVPLLVHIKLSSLPAGAAVSIEGKAACDATPCEIVRRPEDGFPVVVLTKKGCDDYRTTIVLENVVDMPYSVGMHCK